MTLKFQRIDPTKLDAEIVAKHQEDLKKILPSFQNDAKIRNYSPYIEWGIAFCDYAQKAHKVTENQERISELESLKVEIINSLDLVTAKL